MKKILLLLVILNLFQNPTLKAQYVTIPDAHFRAFLQANLPSCMSGNQLDTTCAATTFNWQSPPLDVHGDSISDLTGIQYFVGLYELDCYSNQLTTLPRLPNTLRTLVCYQNHLTSLPVLPDSMTDIYCYNNQLASIPSLPNTLTDLWCYNNLITSLPNIPNSITTLLCNSNNISCLPVLPNTITTLNVSGNPFHCLPNYISAMNASLLAYPLCVTGDSVNNPNGCAEISGIAGYSYKDNNGNCVFDILDLSKPNLPIKLYDIGNNLLSQTSTLISGIYDFPEPIGTYTVKIDTSGLPFAAQCIHPGFDSTVTLTTINPLQTNVNFAITCKPGFDVGIQSVVPIGIIFPGQQHYLGLVAGDMTNWYNLRCASGVSGQVVIAVTGPVTYFTHVGSLTPTVVGNVFTYSIADFGTINSLTAFGLVFTTNTNAVNGDTICVSVSVTPTAGDNNVSNNTYNYCYYVGNSYDPNYKETYPVNVHTGFTDYFTYTIHFQNTGTAAAQNIRVQDTLDANLDLNTFQVINYSHYNTTWLTGNKLSVNFPNINLPDSSSNFNGSQGFIQYRIKPKAGLPAGTLLHNTGYIYFDYNAPIVTNTTVNEFMGTAGVNNNIQHPTSLSIFPNPSNGIFTINTAGVKIKEIKVIDLLGCEILSFTSASSVQAQLRMTGSATIDLSGYAKGIYFVEVQTEEGVMNRKIVLQ